MTSYRGYAIRGDGRIKRGAYLAAATAIEAHDAAVELCDDDIDHVEVWADAKKIDDVDCQEEGSEDSAKSASAS